MREKEQRRGDGGAAETTSWDKSGGREKREGEEERKREREREKEVGSPTFKREHSECA